MYSKSLDKKQLCHDKLLWLFFKKKNISAANSWDQKTEGQ